MSVTVKNEADTNRCVQCERSRKDHGYARHREGNEGVCNHFRPTPLRVEYRPPEGDRGKDPARFSTTVIREVTNCRHEVVEVHTYHEAELRQLDACARTKLSRMQLVMPDLDAETEDWRDCDGDRSYRRQYLLFTPTALYVEGGAWMFVEGFAYAGDREDGLSSYAAHGPTPDTTLIRLERWRQYVPRDAHSFGDEEE